jgi:hypothetical protein
MIGVVMHNQPYNFSGTRHRWQDEEGVKPIFYAFLRKK